MEAPSSSSSGMMTYEQEKEEKLRLAREKLKQFRLRKKESERPSPQLEASPPSEATPPLVKEVEVISSAETIPQKAPSPQNSSPSVLTETPTPQQIIPDQTEEIRRQYEVYCQTLSNQVTSLQEALSSSSLSHREEMESLKHSYEEKIQDLTSSVQICVSEKSELTLGLDKSQREVIELRDQIKSLEERLQEALSSSAGQFEDSQKLELKEEEVKALRKELSETNDAVINDRHEISEITSKLKSKSELAESFERQFAETKSQLEMAELNLSQMRNCNPDELLSEKNEEIVRLRSEMEAQEKRVSELSAYIQQSNVERDQIINQYTSYSQQLVAQIEALNKTLTEKLEENAKLNESEKSLLTTVLNLENRLQELNNIQTEAEKLKTEAGNEVERVEEIRTRMEELQVAHDQLFQEKGLLVSQCDQQDNKIQELSIALEDNLLKISSMETEMEMLRSNFERAPLNNNIHLMESMESDKVAASRAMSQNQELKKQLEELQSALVNLTNTKAELMNELEDLKRQNIFLSKCANESEGVKAIFEEKNRTIKTLSDQLKRLLHQQEEQQSKLLESREMKQDLEMASRMSEENKALESKLEVAKTEVKNLESQNAELRAQLSSRTPQPPLVSSDSPKNTPPSSVSSDASYVHVEVPDASEMLATQPKMSSSSVEAEEDRMSLNSSSSTSMTSSTTTLSSCSAEGPEEVSSPIIMPRDMSAVPNLEMDVAHFKLQQKFHDAMKKIADLMNEKDYLEHIVVQLQEETETVGEYITLYQYQRSMQKKSLEEKEKQLQKVCRDREELRSKMERLQKLLTHFVQNKEGDSRNALILNGDKSSSEPTSGDESSQVSALVPEKQQHTPQFHSSVPSSYAQGEEEEDSSAESKETASKILSLLNEIGTSSLKEEFRPWFWGTEAGQLITI